MDTVRKLEKALIFTWLIQEIVWLYMWRNGGVVLIALSTAIGIMLVFKSYKFKDEFLLNLALSIWTLANSTWMIYEFFESCKIMKTCTLILFVTSFILFATGFKKTKH
jgi:hypothetical protein